MDGLIPFICDRFILKPLEQVIFWSFRWTNYIIYCLSKTWDIRI